MASGGPPLGTPPQPPPSQGGVPPPSQRGVNRDPPGASGNPVFCNFIREKGAHTEGGIPDPQKGGGPPLSGGPGSGGGTPKRGGKTPPGGSKKTPPGYHKLEAAISDRKYRRRPLALVRSRWRLAARASTQTLPHVSLAERGYYHRAIPCPSEYLALVFLFVLSSVVWFWNYRHLASPDLLIF